MTKSAVMGAAPSTPLSTCRSGRIGLAYVGYGGASPSASYMLQGDLNKLVEKLPTHSRKSRSSMLLEPTVLYYVVCILFASLCDHLMLFIAFNRYFCTFPELRRYQSGTIPIPES